MNVWEGAGRAVSSLGNGGGLSPSLELRFTISNALCVFLPPCIKRCPLLTHKNAFERRL